VRTAVKGGSELLIFVRPAAHTGNRGRRGHGSDGGSGTSWCCLWIGTAPPGAGSSTALGRCQIFCGKPGCDRDPRLELGGLGCPDAEKPFSLAFRVHAGCSIVADRGPDVDKCQSRTAQAGLPRRPENSPARLGRPINADDKLVAVHDLPAMMGVLLVVQPQPCRGHRRSARPKRHSFPGLESPEGRLLEITSVVSTLHRTPRSQC